MHRTSTKSQADVQWILSILHKPNYPRLSAVEANPRVPIHLSRIPFYFPIVLYSCLPYILTALNAWHAGRRWLRHNANASFPMRYGLDARAQRSVRQSTLSARKAEIHNESIHIITRQT